MATITLTWSLPAVEKDQRPISKTLVEISASPDAFGWTQHKVVPLGSDTQVVFEDAVPGAHYFRLTVVDDNGARSRAVELAATVTARGPSPVVDAEALVS